MKILVIEDEKSLIEFLKKGLKCKGYEVDLAATGSSGIKKAREHIYDVILLDILLPGKEDGFEVCKILRESGVKTPILMLTALGTAKDKIKGLEMRYIEKGESQDTSFGIINNERITIHCLAQEKPLVIIIKSKFIAHTLKNYFEYMWKKCKE